MLVSTSASASPSKALFVVLLKYVNVSVNLVCLYKRGITEAKLETTSIVGAVELELCVGCCCCEVACSFHHTRGFQPAVSSIQVHRDEKKKSMTITLLSTCDLCRGEGRLFCVQSCPREGVLSPDLIASLVHRK